MDFEGTDQLFVFEIYYEILVHFLIHVDYLVHFEFGGDVRQLDFPDYFVLDFPDKRVEEYYLAGRSFHFERQELNYEGNCVPFADSDFLFCDEERLNSY
jgi:hypothetical protein